MHVPCLAASCLYEYTCQCTTRNPPQTHPSMQILDSWPQPMLLRLHSVKKHSINVKRCTDKAMADYRSAHNWRPIIGRLPINTKNSFAVLFVTYLCSDCYPRTLTYLKDCRVQTNKNTPKSKVIKCTHFYRKWKPLSYLFTFGNRDKNLY